MKILLIEDDETLVKMYKTLLENHGYVIDVAANGIDGLDKALGNHPDLILLDIRLPKMNGMTVLQKLRQDSWGATVKVIILTNLDTTDQSLNQIFESHPSYYLIKTNTKPETVLEHINEVLSGQSQ